MLIKNIFKRIPMNLICCFCVSLVLLAVGCGKSNAPAGPKLGQPAQGKMLDKSADTELNNLITTVSSKFIQKEYTENGTTIKYNLYIPENPEKNKKYPLVMFIADASTTGREISTPLTQGYGALVWATEEAQKKNPCYVLAPQFSGVAVNDAYQHTGEVDLLPGLLKAICAENSVDNKRIYATGQSMGGMISMYLNTLTPRIFAASLFVDCHWDESNFNQLVQNPFIFINAGTKGKSWQTLQKIEDAARAMSKNFTWAEWSAKLPQNTQDDLAQTMLEKKAPINLITFEDGSVLPDNSFASEHVYSFDYAYKIKPVRDWLFKYSLQKDAF